MINSFFFSNFKSTLGSLWIQYIETQIYINFDKLFFFIKKKKVLVYNINLEKKLINK